MKFFIIILTVFFLMFSVQAETEEETISKCLQDLSSKDVKVRRRAVLILCKYAKSSVYTQLIPHLEDPDPKVRQSIVVGFIESRMTMRDSAIPLIRRLADSILIEDLKRSFCHSKGSYSSS